MTTEQAERRPMLLASPPIGPWVHTASGRAVSLIDPDPDSISIRDIAAHLAKLCRFAGATATHYSVAQHSMLVSKLVADLGPQAAMYGLLHDAHEAYCGDVSTPMKGAIADVVGAPVRATAAHPVDRIAGALDRAIAQHVGIPMPIPARVAERVAHADLRALATERRDLLRDDPSFTPSWGRDLPAPMRSAIKPLPWPKAEERFLAAFDDLAILLALPTSTYRNA